MTLQEIKYPTDDKCNIYEMFFNGDDYQIDKDKILISPKGIVSTDTYFNAFSVNKWIEYTNIEKVFLDIEVSGKCELFICEAYIDENNVIRRKGDNKYTVKKENSNREELMLEFDVQENNTIAYFGVKALSDEVTIYRASYVTDKEYELNNINIVIGICTYKREEFVYRNVQEIKKLLIENKDSPLYGHLSIFISDNGRSLDRSKIESDKVKVFDNPNYGGSGGFTRCIIEANKRRKCEKYTHVILMDDDVLLDCVAIERTYRLLTLLKKQYKDCMIGGAMLVLDERNRQFELAAKYYQGTLFFKQKNADLRTIRNVIQNEMSNDCNYNAWCYCCMPLNKIDDDNLPLPLFIHMDDVEYGVRNNFSIITMNGIFVWHPFFANQRGAHIVYYDVRNKLITMSELGGVDIRTYANKYLEMFHRSIFNYDYERTLMACRGIEDFCKGIDNFKKIDPVELNNNLLKVNRKWFDADEKIRSKITKPIYHDVSRKTLIKTYFFPAKEKEIVLDCNISDAYPNGAKKLIIYNRSTNKYCIYEKNIKKMIQAKRACRHAKKLIDNVMLDVSFEWKDRINEIQNIEFWNKYLKLEE